MITLPDRFSSRRLSKTPVATGAGKPRTRLSRLTTLTRLQLWPVFDDMLPVFGRDLILAFAA